jgi:hypothetical protein
MSYFDDYIEGIAQALWATAWADWVEELDEDDPRAVNLSGCEITQIMPVIPDKVKTEAAILLGRIIEKIGSHWFYGRFREFADDKEVGHYLAMEAMGHGVSLKDNHDIEYPKLPHVENPFGTFYDMEGLV